MTEEKALTRNRSIGSRAGPRQGPTTLRDSAFTGLGRSKTSWADDACGTARLVPGLRGWLPGRQAERFGIGPAVMLGQDLAEIPAVLAPTVLTQAVTRRRSYVRFLGVDTERWGSEPAQRSRLLAARHRHVADGARSQRLSPRVGYSRRSPLPQRRLVPASTGRWF